MPLKPGEGLKKANRTLSRLSQEVFGAKSQASKPAASLDSPVINHKVGASEAVLKASNPKISSEKPRSSTYFELQEDKTEAIKLSITTDLGKTPGVTYLPTTPIDSGGGLGIIDPVAWLVDTKESLSEREIIFQDSLKGKTLEIIRSNDISLLKHADVITKRGLVEALGEHYSYLDMCTVRYQFLSKHPSMVTILGHIPIKENAHTRWLLSVDSKMVEFSFFAKSHDKGRLFESVNIQNKKFFIKDFPLKNNEDHPGVISEFEDLYSLEIEKLNKVSWQDIWEKHTNLEDTLNRFVENSWRRKRSFSEGDAVSTGVKFVKDNF
jgi:hypothetical protein